MLQKKQSGHKPSMSVTDYKYKQLLSSCQHEHPSAHHGIGELTQYKREREREKKTLGWKSMTYAFRYS